MDSLSPLCNEIVILPLNSSYYFKKIFLGQESSTSITKAVPDMVDTQ